MHYKCVYAQRLCDHFLSTEFHHFYSHLRSVDLFVLRIVAAVDYSGHVSLFLLYHFGIKIGK